MGRVELTLFHLAKKPNKDYTLLKILEHDSYLWLKEKIFYQKGHYTDVEDRDSLIGSKDNSFLNIDAFWIVPEWRGQMVGGTVLNELFYHYEHICRMVLVQPWAILSAKTTNKGYLDYVEKQDEWNLTEDTEKFTEFFTKQRFKPIEETNILCFDLCEVE